jgi:ferredoxin-fold anticodon binding domain-containing protein
MIINTKNSHIYHIGTIAPITYETIILTKKITGKEMKINQFGVNDLVNITKLPRATEPPVANKHQITQ